MLRFLKVILVAAFAFCAVPRSLAHADAQVSLRNFLEFGKQWRGEDVEDFVVGLGVRGDALFGPARPGVFRLGPAFELRTVDFFSAEAAAGATLLVPVFKSLPVGLTGMAGYSLRRRGPETPMAIGIATWGFRDYNYESMYGYALNLAVSARKSIGDPEVLEITGGFEVDMQFTTLVPLLFFKNLFTSEDPHEK